MFSSWSPTVAVVRAWVHCSFIKGENSCQLRRETRRTRNVQLLEGRSLSGASPSPFSSKGQLNLIQSLSPLALRQMYYLALWLTILDGNVLGIPDVTPLLITLHMIIYLLLYIFLKYDCISFK